MAIELLTLIKGAHDRSQKDEEYDDGDQSFYRSEASIFPIRTWNIWILMLDSHVLILPITHAALY